MKVLVCGGLDYVDAGMVDAVLDGIRAKFPHLTIIHGGARGADSLADRYAFAHSLRKLVFLADWDKHGKSAGMVRNARMLLEGKPNLVVAFPGGRGTANMIEQAEAKGIKVVKVQS